jgi:DNA-directed RNA polymerase subunit RPC12/RpoP
MLEKDDKGRFLKGHKSHNKGKHLSEATKNKITETKKRLYFEGKLVVWNKNRKKRVCLNCKKRYEISPYREKENKFCSMKCYGEYRHGKTYEEIYGKNIAKNRKHMLSLSQLGKHRIVTKKRPKIRYEVICDNCGRSLKIIKCKLNQLRHFCSIKCDIAWRKKHPEIFSKFGVNHHNWKNGISYIDYPLEFKKLRKKIKARDGYRCQYCGFTEIEHKIKFKGKGLHVHHRDHNKKNNLPENLLTLCNICNVNEAHSHHDQSSI